MIFLIGDTHRRKDVEKLLNIDFLVKDDYVIILGDCGIVLDDIDTLLLDELSKKPFNILFIDGNHEGYEILNNLPIEEWNGGKVHKLSDNIYHLLRGEIFTIEDKKILAFGGAETLDKLEKIEGINWWKDEVPSFEEMTNCMNNLKKYDFNVDYILTHDCRTSTLYELCKLNSNFKSYPNIFNDFLESIYQKTNFKHWYFGHYHLDLKCTKKETTVFNKLTCLK